MSADCLAVDIGSSFIKVMFGNRKEVKSCEMLPTPEGSLEDNKIVNTDMIVSALDAYIKQKLQKKKIKNISFVIHGQDIIVRHSESPMMDDKGLRNSVEWEMSQYLPENGQNHYIDYEILEKINTRDKKVCKILVVAAPKEKIDALISIARGLRLSIKSVDLSSNCLARSIKNASRMEKSIGVIDFGYKTTCLSIIDNGKLFMEREVPFGISNVLKEIMNSNNMDEEQAYNYFMNNFNFNNVGEAEVLNKRILFLFENVFSTFEKIIEFYTSGKSNKYMDRLYVTGGGCQVNGVEYYMNNYFSCKTFVVDSFEKIYTDMKRPRNVNLKFYLPDLGLLMRKE